MGTEIERRFLIGDPDLFREHYEEHGGYVSSITQGYLAQNPVTRVRHTYVAPGKEYGTLTVKGPGTLTRSEWEYQIPAVDAEEMLTLCADVLRKNRMVVFSDHDGLKWEVDQFTDDGLRGLWVAEIELPSPDTDFPRPQWLGREVTHDPRYTNVALARTHTIPHEET